jgi:4-carboxymuconolactone decarboxylase
MSYELWINTRICFAIVIKIGIILVLCCFKLVAQTPDMLNTIFPKGEKVQGGNFTGTTWVTQLFPADSTLNASIGNVVFEPKARSKWHVHPGGQTLLALEGVGYYQEKGKTVQILKKGDVVRCPPDVEHWHGASPDNWFVQLAITPEHPRGRVIWLQEVNEEAYLAGTKQQEALNTLHNLGQRYQSIVAISAYTSKGDLEQLSKALEEGLNAGLTVNETKEVLVHLYAYCGFPRSIQGINTLMAVLDNRKAKGIVDNAGKMASPITDTLRKYEQGKKVLESLTGQPQIAPPKSGYGAFSPETDVFLKEHLFADLFGRDVLDYKDREIATITALATMGGLEPMLKNHIGIALNIGVTSAQLSDVLNLIEAKIGRKEAETGRKLLNEAVSLKKK